MTNLILIVGSVAVTALVLIVVSSLVAIAIYFAFSLMLRMVSKLKIPPLFEASLYIPPKQVTDERELWKLEKQNIASIATASEDWKKAG